MSTGLKVRQRPSAFANLYAFCANYIGSVEVSSTKRLKPGPFSYQARK